MFLNLTLSCKNSPFHTRKKLKNEKIVLQETKDIYKPTSDDNDQKVGYDTVVVGETWCSETEGMLSETENDDSECELLQLPAKKTTKKRSTRSGHALHSIGKSLNPK